MTEQLTPAKLATRMSRAIRDEITALILARGLSSGDPLPTETELVEALGVSRNSIREALKALQALDIVEIRHGYGTYVGRLSLDPLADGLTFRALHDISRDLRSLEEIIEVREALEAALIRRVAATVPEEDPNPVQTVRRHRAIVTALRKRDVARAEHAMVEHFRNLGRPHRTDPGHLNGWNAPR